MAKELKTPGIEAELQPFTFAGVNNPDGSAFVVYAQTQVEALQKLKEFQAKNKKENKEPESISNQSN